MDETMLIRVRLFKVASNVLRWECVDSELDVSGRSRCYFFGEHRNKRSLSFSSLERPVPFASRFILFSQHLCEGKAAWKQAVVSETSKFSATLFVPVHFKKML